MTATRQWPWEAWKIVCQNGLNFPHLLVFSPFVTELCSSISLKKESTNPPLASCLMVCFDQECGRSDIVPLLSVDLKRHLYVQACVNCWKTRNHLSSGESLLLKPSWISQLLVNSQAIVSPDSDQQSCLATSSVHEKSNKVGLFFFFFFSSSYHVGVVDYPAIANDIGDLNIQDRKEWRKEGGGRTPKVIHIYLISTS